jgi:hypothetical protein
MEISRLMNDATGFAATHRDMLIDVGRRAFS